MVWFAEAHEFTADQLAAMVAQATGGELHAALAPEPVWLDEQEAVAARRALEADTALYCADPADVDEPAFADLAELLSTPPEARYGWITDIPNDVRLGVLAANSRWFGLVAVREDDSIWVRTFPPENPSDVLAATLPDSWKSSAQPIGVMRSEMLAADDGSRGFIAPRTEVRRAQRVVALKPHVIAEFYAAVRDTGKARSSPHPIRIYDTDDGRWTVRITTTYSDERLDLAPADQHDVTHLLDGLARELR